MNNWIDVNDRLPEVGQAINFINDLNRNSQDADMHRMLKMASPLVEVRFGFVYESVKSELGNYIQTGLTENYNSINGFNGLGCHITHWQPLPEPPTHKDDKK